MTSWMKIQDVILLFLLSEMLMTPVALARQPTAPWDPLPAPNRARYQKHNKEKGNQFLLVSF